MTEREYTREDKVLLHTFFIAEGLIDKGLIEGPKYLTKDGKANVEKWIAEGFTPTQEEVNWAMDAITAWQQSDDVPPQ